MCFWMILLEKIPFSYFLHHVKDEGGVGEVS